MIRSFNCRDTEALFRDQDNVRFRAIERVARRKLLYLHRAKVLDDLRAPPETVWKRLKAPAKGNTAFASTTNGAFALAGRTEMLMTSRLSTITEVTYGR